MIRTLIIDDDLASCRTLEVLLSGQGHQVRLAHTFEDGIVVGRACLPHLLILDHRMPGISGLEGLPQFKREFPDTQVIMVTAYHDRETVQRALRDGAIECLAKPLDINELDAALAHALAQIESSNDGQLS